MTTYNCNNIVAFYLIRFVTGKGRCTISTIFSLVGIEPVAKGSHFNDLLTLYFLHIMSELYAFLEVT